MICLLGLQSDGELLIGFFCKNPVILASLSGYLLTMCSTCKSCCLLSDANIDTFCHAQTVFFETNVICYICLVCDIFFVPFCL